MGIVVRINCTNYWFNVTITFLSPVMFVLPKQLYESFSTIVLPNVNHCNLRTTVTEIVLYVLLLIRVKSKVNFTLKQAMKVQRVSRDIVLLFL